MLVKKEKLKDLENKKIALLGLGIENLAFLKFILKKKIDFKITICDQRGKKELGERASFKNKNIKFSLGKNYDKNLEKHDIVMRSPGYPLFSKKLVRAKKKGVEITSPIKLFFKLCPTKNIIGITGTKGKGTTSSLIHGILKAAQKKSYLGGNIGLAPFEFLEKLNLSDFVVLELSSFQLEDLDRSPRIGVMTNLYKEHLAPADPLNPNYHKSIPAYLKAKLNIFKYQKKTDIAVINKKLKPKLRKYKLPGKKIYFSRSELSSKLVGEHNRENVAAAEGLARVLKIKKEVVTRAVKNFSGLPHRIELVAQKNGVEYYDDSFATTPESSIIALKSFKKPIILLAGGADKGADFKAFAMEIKKRVKFLILFKGKGTNKLRKVLKIKKEKLKTVSSMKEAIRIAKGKAVPGDIVLLSAGCASFGVFKNYKDRGNQFKKEAKK